MNRNHLCKAVKDFRQSLGDTQFEFAQRLGMFFSTVVRYESTRAPQGHALTLLAYIAKKNGLTSFEELFTEAACEELSAYIVAHIKKATR